MKTMKIITLSACFLLTTGIVLNLSTVLLHDKDTVISPSPLIPSDAEPAKPPDVPQDPTSIDYWHESGRFELPVNGASGYAALSLNLLAEASGESETLNILSAGQGFRILLEEGEWWKIDVNGEIGWIMHKFCLINLPDVVPSIIYENTNASASILKSSGKDIPNITGQQLYKALGFNDRFDKNIYAMPVLYAMAQKICAAQQAALVDGNTLILYEGFRPYAVQHKIASNLGALANQDREVNDGISTSPWSMNWFISTAKSNHQRGNSIDVSLAKIEGIKEVSLNGFTYQQVTKFEAYIMPSDIHELSLRSAVFQGPVDSRSAEAWKTAPLSTSMNGAALLLQKYISNAGLTPIASEWWHFNDLSLAEIARDNLGEFTIDSNYSVEPEDIGN